MPRDTLGDRARELNGGRLRAFECTPYGDGPPHPLHRSLSIYNQVNRERRWRWWINDLNFTKEGGVCSLAVLLKGRMESLNIAEGRINGLQDLELPSQRIAAATVTRKVQSWCRRFLKRPPGGSLIDARNQLLTSGCDHIEKPETSRVAWLTSWGARLVLNSSRPNG